MNPRAINKRVIESLAAAGAFDALDSNRARVFAGAEAILAACQRSHEAATMGQNDMFGGAADAPTIMLPQIEPWLPAERLRREYDAIGFFLSGHPLDDYATVLKRLRVQSWAEFSRAVKTGATAGKVAATVVSRMERRTKTGNKMGIIGLSDPTGHFEAVLFSEGLAQYRELLEPGAAVLLQLGAELQGEDVRARVLHAEPLDDAAAKTQKGLRIFVRDTRPLGVDRRAAADARDSGRAPLGGRTGDLGDTLKRREASFRPVPDRALRAQRPHHDPADFASRRAAPLYCLGHLQPLGDELSGRVSRTKDAQAFLGLRRGVVQRLGVQHRARTSSPCNSAPSCSSTAAPGSSSSRYCARPPKTAPPRNGRSDRTAR